MTSCGRGKKYVGETLSKVSTRITQHQKSITDEKMGHKRRCRPRKYLPSRILLDRDETLKKGREKSTRSIGNSTEFVATY